MLTNRNLEELTERLRRELPRLRREYAVRTRGIFGSYVRGEQTGGSDLDILVEFDHSPGILRFMQLEGELSKISGVHADLVQKEALKPAIGKRILDELRPL